MASWYDNLNTPSVTIDDGIEYPPLGSFASEKFHAWRTIFMKQESITPLFHYKLSDLIFTPNNYQVVQAFRGSGKSTVVTRDLPLYISIFGELENFGKCSYMLIISETTSQAEDLIREIKTAYDDNDMLQQYLMKGDVWKADEIEFVNHAGEVISIVAKGSGQSLRGIKRRGKRPQLIFVDDLEDDEAVRTKEGRRKTKDWYFKVLLPTRDPKCNKIFFIGTPLHSDSLLENLSKQKLYNCVKFPKIKDDGTSQWEDRFSLESIKEERDSYRSQGMEHAWMQEMMLQVINEDSQIFKRDYFRYFEHKEIAKHLHGFNYFTSVDLAISKKETADYTVIATIGVSPDNIWYIVDITYGRWAVDETIEELFKIYRKFRPISVAIETVAFQMAFSQIIEKEMIKRNMFFRIEPMKNTSKKELRIQALEPRYKQGTIYHQVGANYLEELEEELLLFKADGTAAKHDDLIDALASLSVTAFPPQGEAYAAEYFDRDDEESVNPYTF